MPVDPPAVARPPTREPFRALVSAAPIALIAVASTGIAAGLVSLPTDPDEMPVSEFDHSAHVERGVECGDCHLGVAEDEISSHAGVPSIAVCAELCHDDLAEDVVARLREQENGRRMVEAVENGTELWWPQAWYLPPDVVFSHRRHVAIGEIECERCHGDIAAATTLPREPVKDTTTMDGCIECHETEGASTDCFACHS